MYGIVDIGSNTMRLVIYKVEGGKPRVLLNKKNGRISIIYSRWYDGSRRYQ